MVVSPDRLVQIVGYGDHPHRKSIEDFFNDNNRSTVTVYRYSNSTKAEQAADWAEWYRRNYSDAEYGFNDLYDYESGLMYCSKLVWDAYYYGAGVSLATSWGTIGGYNLKMSKPYDLPNSANVRAVYTR
ncbi:YiiX/YebB-like N1pC/P60 family cysteine hydrolase [Brevibacillus massiliensis]|uniref:YiiX/YebB-like N1pC/P60 family cysteine hydrolase n=1 Tax=Brevibacillus massiliensis TaxID=1118054 RepID=UPI0028FCD5E4|nr:YiiX/YebB-like N1pC/P60 family cysteine hydrolase [Brevibacillus massiliensis]